MCDNCKEAQEIVAKINAQLNQDKESTNEPTK